MAWVAVKYALFAVLATLCNLGSQRIVLAFSVEGFAFGLALVVGTAVGLVVKFLLDKRWIFNDPRQNPKREIHKFSLYTTTGIGTTLIFWASETLFWIIWQTTAMREVGAVIGLTIGYVVKFNLDRRFVFRRAFADNSDPASDRECSDGE